MLGQSAIGEVPLCTLPAAVSVEVGPDARLLVLWAASSPLVVLVCHPEAPMDLRMTAAAPLTLICRAEPVVHLPMTAPAPVPLSCSPEQPIPLSMRADAMPAEQTIKIIRAQDLQLRFTMDRPTALTNWTVTFKVLDGLAGTARITKTVGAGVTLTDATKGIITVALAKADTSALTVTTGLAKGKGYVWELTRTNAGYQTVLARGELVLEQEVV